MDEFDEKRKRKKVYRCDIVNDENERWGVLSKSISVKEWESWRSFSTAGNSQSWKTRRWKNVSKTPKRGNTTKSYLFFETRNQCSQTEQLRLTHFHDKSKYGCTIEKVVLEFSTRFYPSNVKLFPIMVSPNFLFFIFYVVKF